MYFGGGYYTHIVAAATAVLGYNYADGQIWEESEFARLLHSVALVGSTAGADCAVEVSVDGAKLGQTQVTNVGAAKIPTTDDFDIYGDYIKRSGVMSVEVVDQAVQTQNGVLAMNFWALARRAVRARGRGGRRRYGRYY